MTDRPTCRGVKANGEACRAALGLIDGLCLTHDPDRQAEASAMRIAGGKAAGESKRAKREAARAAVPADVPAVPKTLNDAMRYFAWNTNAVVTGRIDARTGHEAAYALNGFKAAAEKREMQEQIAELRRQIADLSKPRRAS
jgi:hypothetical protein